MKSRQLMTFGAVALLATIAVVDPAWAQSSGTVDGSWVEPIINFFKSIQSGLGQLGAIAVGIGVTVLGLWAGFSGKLDWNRAIWIVLGGVLVVAGPEMSVLLLGSASGS